MASDGRGCTRCNAPAVALLRYNGNRLCREHFLRSFDRRAKRELAEQGRLPAGRIAVALSGGKDSVSLLHFLVQLTRDRDDVELVAVSVDEGIEGYRESALDICRQVTTEWGVAWHVVRTEDLAGFTIDAFASGGAGKGAPSAPRPACGPCGVFRRLGLNQVARQLGCAAVVTGHNLDDAAQTVLMNHLNGDVERLARLAPHPRPKPGLIPRLQPFRMVPEKEVLLYALLNDLPVHDEAECPYAARAHRFRMRDVLLELEAHTPGTRHSLLRGADRLKPLLLDHFDGERAGASMSPCTTCGEPTSGTVCKACQWKG
ncbi:MAG: TIGR00269 family protein [Thermoplasmatota archaeon]